MHITIAALLVSEACNIGWTPVIKHSVPALTRNRSRTWMRPICGWTRSRPLTPP
uniref:hypothetical protein n=1 Tax=Saccharopolyspora phatthalungensis TaxID=664693 RepID=UPI0035E41F2C